MKSGYRRWLALLAACGLALPVLAQTTATEALAFRERLLAPPALRPLQTGGYVLFMRHGITDSRRPDDLPGLDLDDCARQRPLTEQGRAQARQLGRYFRQLRIPVHEVIYSPLCRARETAQLAFGRQAGRLRSERLLISPVQLAEEEKAASAALTRRLLSTPVPPGSNRVVVAHAPTLVEAMAYFVGIEGTVVVIRPLGEGRFEYVGSITPSMWPELVRSLTGADRAGHAP